MLIVVDDLQWADAATAGAVVTLSRRLATHPVSWLLALRGGELPDAAGEAVSRLKAVGATEIRLGPLDEPAVAQVAHDVLGGEPDEALRRVLTRADGQPFLLTELLGGLLGRPPLELRGEIREAIAAGLLAEDGDRLRFRHDLVREAVDASLPGAVRRSMRRTAIDVMLRHGSSAADVAQLVMDVAEPGDVASADLLRRAAAQIGQVSPAVAVPLSRRALDLTGRGDPERGETVAQAIDLLVQSGQPHLLGERRPIIIGLKRRAA